MLSALEIGLGLAGGVVFLALLQRAFFSGKIREEAVVFERLDLVIGLLLTGLFAFVALGLFYPSPKKNFSENDLVNSLVVQILMGGGLIAYLRFRKISVVRFFRADGKSIGKLIFLGTILMFGIFPMIGLIGGLIHSDPSQEQDAVKFFRGDSSLQARLLLAFMAVFVAPLVEEMVFRGLLYRIFQTYIGKIGAMFFTSLLFAAIHLNIPTLVPLAILSFALTAGLELHGSLVLNIAMHATFNAVSLLLMLGPS